MSGNSTRKTLADACGIAPATFAAWRDESLARRAEWLARAEALKPRLFRRNIAPSGQAWMVLGGLVTGEEAQLCLLDTLANPAAVRPVSPYAVHGVVEALHVAGLHREANKRLYAYWGRMADAGADTFWEVFVPEDPLASPYGTPLLNSHCHAWSCAPAWVLRKVNGADCRWREILLQSSR